MVKVEEHLQKIKEVQKQLKQRWRKERDEVLTYLKKRKE